MLRNAPGWVVSAIIHALIFAGVGMMHFPAAQQQVMLAIETFFKDEDRIPEEFQTTLDQQLDIAETLNFQAGGPMVAAASGGSSVQVQQTKIDKTTEMPDVDVAFNPNSVDVPGLERIGQDLGMEAVSGEVGAVVTGYGAALDRLTQEIIREMRDQKVLVVWMFDESESMKDDQADIKKRFHRIYEELKLVDDDSKADVLMSAIVSYGENLHYQTPVGKATNSIPEIMRAIDKIPNDASGKENTFSLIPRVISDYRNYYTRAGRKLILVLVSDESGDDGENVDAAVEACKRARTSVYVMGRESVFGSLFAYVNWVEPVYKDVTHRLPVRRGPETPLPELLQFDGFNLRMDASLSGFGPYEQSRLARDTGGIFFMLPSEEQNIVEADTRKYAALDLRPYAPDIGTRRDYVQSRDRSKFRKAIWEAILLLDPRVPGNDKVEVHPHDFVLQPGAYGNEVTALLNRSSSTYELLQQARSKLEAVKPLRAREESARWRANYDLILGQVMSYQVRLFQYAAGLEKYAAELPKMKHNPKNNRWGVGHGAAELMAPSDAQVKKYKVTLDDIRAAKAAALAQFDLTMKEHPNTPWANRAAWEKTRGFGASYHEWFYQPPPPHPPNGPKPQPVPKL